MAVGTTGSAPGAPAPDGRPAPAAASTPTGTAAAGTRAVPSALRSAARRDPATARRRRPARLVTAVALVAGALAVWELGAVHDDGPLFGGQEPGWSSCTGRTEAGLVDVTVGGVLAEPTADVVVLDVRAVRPQNVLVREGMALPVFGDRDGDGTETVVGEGFGYPPDLTGTDLVWAQGEPLVGALLAREARTNLVWHVEIGDEARDAGYDAVEIEYRSGHRRYLAVVQHDLLVPGGADPEACWSR